MERRQASATKAAEQDRKRQIQLAKKSIGGRQGSKKERESRLQDLRLIMLISCVTHDRVDLGRACGVVTQPKTSWLF